MSSTLNARQGNPSAALVMANVHDEDLISMISCTTVGWPLRPRDERANRAPVNNVAASNQPAGRPLGSG
jgi:hypothetical protein